MRSTIHETGFTSDSNGPKFRADFGGVNSFAEKGCGTDERIIRRNAIIRAVGRVRVGQEVAGALTPVPGGVGPLTIAMLMANTVKAARMRRGRRSWDRSAQ